MGSDDTHVTDPELPVQEPETASAAKTTSSNGSGGFVGRGASRSSSRRHQEQERVQNLKDRCEVMDVPMGPENNLIDETKVAVQEREITSDSSVRSGRADPTPPDSSVGGDGSGASCPRSLTQEQHVRNLKENLRRVLGFSRIKLFWPNFEDDPCFARVVAQMRANPCLDHSELEVFKKKAEDIMGDVGPLHLAVLMGDLEMVQKILKTPLGQKAINTSIAKNPRFHYSALDLAIVGGESEIVDVLLEKNAKLGSLRQGSLQLAVRYVRVNEKEKIYKIFQLLDHHGINITAKDGLGFSPFYIAVAKGKTGIVKELLKSKDKIQLNEGCVGGPPPIQIAHEQGFKDMESALMECDAVSRYVESAFRDRQAYVDAANAILVGAALIASVTFASWLQPPLNYTTTYHVDSSEKYVDVEHNSALGMFWVFNTLSFYFAIATVVFGAHSVLPRRQLFITENVKKLSQNLLFTSVLLVFSVLFVIVAFGIAGFIVLIPILRYRWYMIAPTMLGGIVCIGSIGYLFKSLWENRPWNTRIRKNNNIFYEIIDDLYYK